MNARWKPENFAKEYSPPEGIKQLADKSHANNIDISIVARYVGGEDPDVRKWLNLNKPKRGIRFHSPMETEVAETPHVSSSNNDDSSI